MRVSNGLMVVAVAKATKPGRYGAGLGLWLQVSRSGTKAGIFRYERHGRARHMGLGPVHTVTPAEARRKATEARKAFLDGRDPIEERRTVRDEGRLKEARAMTLCDQHSRGRRPGSDHDKHFHAGRAAGLGVSRLGEPIVA